MTFTVLNVFQQARRLQAAGAIGGIVIGNVSFRAVLLQMSFLLEVHSEYDTCVKLCRQQ